MGMLIETTLNDTTHLKGYVIMLRYKSWVVGCCDLVTSVQTEQ